MSLSTFSQVLEFAHDAKRCVREWFGMDESTAADVVKDVLLGLLQNGPDRLDNPRRYLKRACRSRALDSHPGRRHCDTAYAGVEKHREKSEREAPEILIALEDEDKPKFFNQPSPMQRLALELSLEGHAQSEVSTISDEKQFTINGHDFMLLEGGKAKAHSGTFIAEIEKIYDRLLKSTARKAETSPEAVQDVLHDVILQELEKVHSGRWKGGIMNLVGYLKTAAVREYWRARRKEKRLVPFSRLGDETVQILLEGPSREPDPLDALVARELAFLAAERLERLPLRQRYVLSKWCSGLEISEIALEAATTAGNVRFHKHAAIQALRAAFGIVREETA